MLVYCIINWLYGSLHAIGRDITREKGRNPLQDQDPRWRTGHHKRRPLPRWYVGGTCPHPWRGQCPPMKIQSPLIIRGTATINQEFGLGWCHWWRNAGLVQGGCCVFDHGKCWRFFLNALMFSMNNVKYYLKLLKLG